MLGPQFLLLSTQGGIRAHDGSPVALGFHVGHWEVGPSYLEDDYPNLRVSCGDSDGCEISWCHVVVVPDAQVYNLIPWEKLPDLGREYPEMSAGISRRLWS